MRNKILSIDYCVTDKLVPLRTLILPFQHATCARRTALESDDFVLASKGLTLEGFTTFMDCCLRTRRFTKRNWVAFMIVNISEKRKWYILGTVK